MADPDERCGVCEETRENHGDKNHEFNAEGQLIPKKQGSPAQNTPPNPAVQKAERDPLLAPVLRLVQTLIAKGILEGDDLVHIFGGDIGNHRGQTGEGSSSDSSSSSPT